MNASSAKANGNARTALRRFALASVPIVCVLLGASVQSHAQIATGRVTGTVKDATGAVVVGANVTLRNDSTGVADTVQTTSTGTYVFEAVNPGKYTLQAASAGFKTFSLSGIETHVQQTVTVDIVFEVGSLAENVTVTAGAALLQAEDASVGQTVAATAVDNMPLNGRNWASLGQLAAGVTTVPSGNSSSAFFAVNGVNYWQNDFRLNGINNNTEMYGGSQVGTNASVTPPPDAIEEFKLQSGNYSAEFGHSTGAVVNAVIKSGGNKVHGDLWEYLRNDAVDANDYFSNQNGIGIAEYRMNQFGGTIGGPVYVPKLYDGRNKTFFFFDYQGTRIVQPSNSTSTVPTPSMVSSGFTNLQDLITDNPGTRQDGLDRTFPLGTVFDPATTRTVAAGAIDPLTGLKNNTGADISVRDPFFTGASISGIQDFTGLASKLNQIPMSRLDPNAVKLLQLYPAATGSGFANNYYRSAKSANNVNQTDVRLDHAFGDNDRLFGVVDWSHWIFKQPPSLPGIANGQGYGNGSSDSPHYAISVGYTHIFNATLTNEFHFGYDHNIDNIIPDEGDTMGIPEQFGIQGVPQTAGNGGLPMINISGLSGIGVAGWEPTIRTIKSLEFSDNVTKIYGSHTFKAGYQIDSIEGDITQPAFGKGLFIYSGQFTSIPNNDAGLTGMADLLLTPSASTVGGVANVGGVATIAGSNYAATNDHRYYMGTYFQDDWKVTPRLTLNLGLRWDLTTPYAETRGRQANFIANNGNGPGGTFYLPNQTCHMPRSASFDSLAQQDGIAIACTGASTGRTPHRDFAPRVGIAYRVTPKLVVRGGYGIAYGALSTMGFGGTLGTNYPFQYTIALNAPTASEPLILPNGQVAMMENSVGAMNLQDPTGVNPASGISLFGRQWDFKTPMTHTYNATVQYQFTKNDSVQAAYVGTLGRNLDNIGYYNSPSVLLPPGANLYEYIPFPDFAPNSTFLSTNGRSRYDSMQAVYERRLAQGISVLANYTYSQCKSSQSAIGGLFPGYRAQWLPGFGIGKEYQLCDTDATNVVHASGTFELPFGKGRHWLSGGNKLAQAVAGGWTVNYIYTYQSGQPFTLYCPISTNAFFGCYANVVPGADIYAGPHNQHQWLNPAAFANPPVAQPGETDFAPLGGSGQQARGPSFRNVDASVFKEFRIGESSRVQFRAEAFNLFNKAQFGNPGNLDFTNAANFSEITGLRGTARLLQFSLKLYY